MKKLLGITLLLLVVAIATTLLSHDPEAGYLFLSPYNLENLLQRIGLYGLLGLGAAFVIVTGGIDLSIGAMVCVAGCVLPWLLVEQGLPAPLAVLAVSALCGLLGAWHGFLITRLGLQPFVVTLCGLLLYRGLMRQFTGDRTMGLGNDHDGLRWFATGKLPITAEFGLPIPLLLLLALALLIDVAWRRTVYGRHLFAVGQNAEAARFAGLRTRTLVVSAYVACGLLSGLAGMLFVLDVNSATAASFGTFYELYGIAAAVLGGIALRGGEGLVAGVVLGTALMQLLPNTIRLVADSDTLEYAIVGAVILLGAIGDALLQRFSGRRRTDRPSPKH
jgi:ribose transport system permease protein